MKITDLRKGDLIVDQNGQRIVTESKTTSERGWRWSVKTLEISPTESWTASWYDFPHTGIEYHWIWPFSVYRAGQEIFRT